MRVAIIGLGAMGAPIAINLLRAGHAVCGCDLRPAALEALVAEGGTAAASPIEAARDAELLLLMVVSGEQAEQVLFGAGGAVPALSANAIVVASCTQAPAQAKRLADRLAAHGIAMLDAPVSGGVAGARAAALTVMCAGPPQALARAQPVLEATAKRVFHVGDECGMGSAAKMINQLLCGVHIVAAAEAMQMAERAGVPLQLMHDIISVSAGNSWMWGDRGPRMMMDDPPVTSAVDIFVKDLGIVLDQGRFARQGLPLASAAHQMFLAASGLGHGAADDSQVIRAYRAMNGARTTKGNT